MPRTASLASKASQLECAESKATAQFFTDESADECDFDLLTCERIRVLQDGEKRAVENEDYDEAERCVQKLSRLKSVGHSIAQLEEEKRLAVSNKAYAQAKTIKAEVDRLRKYAEEGPLPDAPVLGGEYGPECSAERGVTEWRLQAPSSQTSGYHVDTAWTGVLQPQHVPWSLAQTASTVEVQHNAHPAGTSYDLAGHACYSQDWSLPYFASGPHPDLIVEEESHLDAHPALRQSQVPALTTPGSLPAKRELGTVRTVSDKRNNRGVPQFAILWTQSGELRVQRRSIAQFAASGPRGAPYRMAAGMEVSFSRLTAKDGTSHAVDVRLSSHDSTLVYSGLSSARPSMG